MQKQTLALLAGAALLVFGGALVVPTLMADDTPPVVHWDAKDEQDLQQPAENETGDPTTATVDRTAVELAEGTALPGDDSRIEVLLHGRVVDKFKAPIADAKVWLDFGRGGPRGGGPGNRQRRVPDPVVTDQDGRFAFQGQTFRNLRVSLQVADSKHAPGMFDKDLGEVKDEKDLGDLVLMNGGELIGRVTDLEGNGVPSATIRLSPENNNPLRMTRNRDNLLAEILTDNNGFYRRMHVPAGDWSVSATAKMHTAGSSATFAVEEDQSVEIDDIRLGPGYEVTGYVRTSLGQPIAKADVTLRSQGRGGRGGQGGPGSGGPGSGGPGSGGPGGANFDWRAAFGRDHSTTTDEQGRFFLEHLPGAPMRLEVRAEGYLDYDQEQLDTTLGQPIQVAMQDGLRIAGTVEDDVDGQLVTSFAVRAVRIRGLPVPGAADIDINAIMTQMRSGNLDDATRQQLQAQMQTARAAMGDMRRGGGQGGPGGGPGQGRGGNGNDPRARDLGKPEKHPDGAFVVTGLQEGVYEVHVQSPEHARFRSPEIEVRFGNPAPTLVAKLDRGVFVAGIVVTEKGQPVKGALVELRTATANDGAGGGRRRGRGGNAGNTNADATPGAAPDFAAMSRNFMMQAAGAQLTLEATTDTEGEFIIKHAPRGTYRVQGQAKGFANATSEVLDVQADHSGVELRLGLLGSITGQVRGLTGTEFSEARVAAVSVGGNGGGFGGMGGMGRGGRGQGGGPGGGGGPFNSVTVQADGTYRIDDLTPGDYIVRSWLGSPQELMRELGPQLFSGTLTADLKVVGGEVAKFDVAVQRPMVGEVSGTVMHNGSPATGFQVELSRVDANGANNNANNNGGGRGPGGGRGGMFGGGRTFQAAVANSGHFSIKDVPAGNYRLRVQAGRRGGMLHEEEVAVSANSNTERNIQVTTASLQGTITCADANAAELSGTVALLPGLSALPENYNAWRRDPVNTTFDARLQNGTFKFDTLTPGNYLLVLSARGRERTSAPIVITPGDGQVTSIATGAVSAQPVPTGNGTPRGGNGGGRNAPGANAPGGNPQGNRPGGNRVR
jgi:hypothetical protein